jgi:hypothetical protein
MTGESKDLRHPVFDYDASGQKCLDSLQDTVSENNPDGLWATAWKDKHWAEPLGLEHMQWGKKESLRCGASARSSCRDAARVGQLWNNNGFWPGHGQLISEEYARRARTWVFPGSFAWAPYGYTLWLWINDEIDAEVGMMGGANAQCTLFAPEQNAVIVSFGMDDQDDCEDVWQASKYAIVDWGNNANASFVKNKIRNANATKSSLHQASFKKFSEQDILNIREFARTNAGDFNAQELEFINQRLQKLGANPI